MRAGNFEQGKTAQCYMLCIINTYKLLTKEGSFDWETGVKTIKSVAPERVAGPGSESIKNCKDAMVTKDNKCMGALEIAKCLYDDNPQNYFLP
ncbi:unnamed protein product [Phaedon cochleariae]|uniref:Uncharacterized protein n=1 Tax=Phaedon cochleariae TaxID=80249 RepID=A0A9P0DN09_PHACE|nr:unnamed protein product [Phaedon cochleariae]